MRFRPDWLRRVLSVPYVPTLGPVHPDAVSADLFDDVAAASRSGRLLPFDKERRWSDRKSHTVLVDEIVHQQHQTIIPTLSRRGNGSIKTYFYGTSKPDHAALLAATRRWCKSHGARNGQVIWFDRDQPATSSTRLLIKRFGAQGLPTASVPVAALDALPQAVRDTFADFAATLSSGFGFLHRKWLSGQVEDPILVTVSDGRIVGAIGSLCTMPDPHDRPVLLPQYFGVLPEHRRRGHGRALWRAAAEWGQRKQAAYQLLQTEVGGPSDTFFLSEGLEPLGFTCTVAA